MSTLEYARVYSQQGWQTVPIPTAEKGPRLLGWGKLRLTLDNLPQYFTNGCNIGVILGPPSGELVDADLDCEEAIELAPLYLPQTDARFGRASKPISHWLYVAAGARFETFADPIAQQTLLELRTTGRDGGCHQTIFPPSTHPSGEAIEWSGDIIEPAVVEARGLRVCMSRLAIGCLMMRYVSETAARRPGPDLLNILWEFDHELGRPAYRWLGKSTPDAPRWQPKPLHERSERDVALNELARAIPNNADWHEWNRIGMAFYVAAGGADEGFIAFDDWSAKSPKYNPHSVEERWRNYRRSPPSRIGLGTLIHLAHQAGWKSARAR